MEANVITNVVAKHSHWHMKTFVEKFKMGWKKTTILESKYYIIRIENTLVPSQKKCMSKIDIRFLCFIKNILQRGFEHAQIVPKHF